MDEGTNYRCNCKQKCCCQGERSICSIQSIVDLPEASQHKWRGKNSKQRAPDHAVGWEHDHFLSIRQQLGKWLEFWIVVKRRFTCQQKYIANGIEECAS